VGGWGGGVWGGGGGGGGGGDRGGVLVEEGRGGVWVEERGGAEGGVRWRGGTYERIRLALDAGGGTGAESAAAGGDDRNERRVGAMEREKIRAMGTKEKREGKKRGGRIAYRSEEKRTIEEFVARLNRHLHEFERKGRSKKCR